MSETTNPIPVVCRCLRSRGSFGSFIGDAEIWQHGEAATAVYWCLRTMGSAGPDEHFAHARLCREGRGCFESPEE